jgi:hypothetical protein
MPSNEQTVPLDAFEEWWFQDRSSSTRACGEP